jgi:hypothetical protein
MLFKSIQGAHPRPFITAGALQHVSAYVRTHEARAPKEAATLAIIITSSASAWQCLEEYETHALKAARRTPAKWGRAARLALLSDS